MSGERRVSGALQMVRRFRRFPARSGQGKALVMADGALLCIDCVRKHYREILLATKRESASAWRASALTSALDDEDRPDCGLCACDLFHKGDDDDTDGTGASMDAAQ